MKNFTPIQCGECGGYFRPTGAAYMYYCTCKTLHVGDFTLDDGEHFGHRPVTGSLILGYVS